MNAADYYEIRVTGYVADDWSSWFEGVYICHEDDGETVLNGMMDQAALHGVLMKIRDLGLPLVSVCKICKGDKK